MKTQEEIVEYIQESDKRELFSTAFTDLVRYLDYEHARLLMKEGTTEEEFEELTGNQEQNSDEVIDRMRAYMVFALGKAKNHRSLSAGRSINHFCNWLWLLDDPMYTDIVEERIGYTNYGVPILKAICDRYEFDYPRDETWFVNMSQGRHCGTVDYECGCGK